MEPKAGERIVGAEVDDDVLTIHLADGRSVSVPLAPGGHVAIRNV